MTKTEKARVLKRIRPLLVSSFFGSFVFWYVVDKLFAENLGISLARMGIIIATLSIFTLVLEVPSGILADRWSRKKVLAVGILFLMVSTLAGAIGTNQAYYWVLSIAWGVYAAMYSGVFEALISDVLIEEKIDNGEYEVFYGRKHILETIGLISGTIFGGLLAGVNIHLPFYVTLIPLVISLVCLSRFREPSVHKHAQDAQLLIHTKQTLRAAVDSRELRYYLLITTLLIGCQRIFWEFGQYWYIQLGLDVRAYGIFGALNFVGLGLAGFVASKKYLKRNTLLVVGLGIFVVCCALLAVPNKWLAAATLPFVIFSMVLAGIAVTSLTQSKLPSHVRSGATSVNNGLGNLFFIPIGILFGILADEFTVSHAVVLPTIIIVITLILSLRIRALGHKSDSLHTT
ncbi:MAG: hypothetical protein QG659_351 [Patescibacteria group bacterium]|jgi:MFS family permease|nr:hypothetical protein [Patescibacteria group bacterium]